MEDTGAARGARFALPFPVRVFSYRAATAAGRFGIFFERTVMRDLITEYKSAIPKPFSYPKRADVTGAARRDRTLVRRRPGNPSEPCISI